jgi:hypothetical protein
MVEMEKVEDKRKRYKCECECGNVFWATKSMFQNWGMNDCGNGTCPKCKRFYNLTLDEENGRMILTEWSEWSKKRKGESFG